MESGKVKIKKENVELDSMFKNISQIFKFRFSDCVKMDLRPANTPLTLYTDENRLVQVFSNLISNALKHTMEGYIAFGYNLIDDGKTVEFFVEDSGAGIAKEDIDMIFQTYMSRDAEKQKGTGLGLALCKVIIEKMKGKIWVESEIGKGSKFIFTLPYEVGNQGVKDGHQSSLVRTIGDTIGDGTIGDTTNGNSEKLVLVAEDEDTNYMLVESVLGRRCKLLRARDGMEAVTMAEEFHPSLILMDIRMPNLNGLDATRIIKEVSTVPVIALSAYAFASDIQDALAAGCNEFIAKPYKLETLIETVDKYLNKAN